MYILKKLVVLLILTCGVWSVLVLATEENDTPAGASTLVLDEVRTGMVCQPGDPVDWWRVYIAEPKDIVVFVDGVQYNDIDLYFYDSYLRLIAQSTGRGEDEMVYGRVGEGWYYIKIEAFYSSWVCTDYYIGVLSADVSGYLRGQWDIDIHRIYMRAGVTYWIFLIDYSDLPPFFDPDLYLVAPDCNTVIAESDNEGNIDVIKYTPRYSGYYKIAAASARGSGYYRLFVGSR